MKYEDGIKILRYNEKTGKWYKDNNTGMTVYLLSDKPCEICGDRFFYCSGNEGNCCTKSCSTKKRNAIYGISKETAKKISKAHIGKISSLESRIKHSETNKKLGKWRKENNPSWKGGVDRPNSDIYYGIDYKIWRRKVFERDHFTCALCDIVGGKMQVHHIKTREKYPELTLDENNGITLCKECHEMIRWKEEKFEEVFSNKISG
jgi:5-methylcytosine-specific restriction endonuclease McrA